jgi:hypothetical protein
MILNRQENWCKINLTLIRILIKYIIKNITYRNLIMNAAMDGDNDENGPSHYNYFYISVFFIFYVIVSSFFMMNIFVGTLMHHYNDVYRYKLYYNTFSI